MVVTMPHVLYDWLYTLGLPKVDLPLSQTALKLLCSDAKPKTQFSQGLLIPASIPIILPYKELFLGSQEKKIVPLNFFCGAWSGWSAGAGTKPDTW